MHLELEVINGPDLDSLQELTFCTKSSIPMNLALRFRVRGVRQAEIDRRRNSNIRAKLDPDRVRVDTLALDGDGYLEIQVFTIINFRPQNRVSQQWGFETHSKVVGGEGATYDAWLKECQSLIHGQDRNGALSVAFYEYSTITRGGTAEIVM